MEPCVSLVHGLYNPTVHIILIIRKICIYGPVVYEDAAPPN